MERKTVWFVVILVVACASILVLSMYNESRLAGRIDRLRGSLSEAEKKLSWNAEYEKKLVSEKTGAENMARAAKAAREEALAQADEEMRRRIELTTRLKETRAGFVKKIQALDRQIRQIKEANKANQAEAVKRIEAERQARKRLTEELIEVTTAFQAEKKARRQLERQASEVRARAAAEAKEKIEAQKQANERLSGELAETVAALQAEKSARRELENQAAEIRKKLEDGITKRESLEKALAAAEEAARSEADAVEMLRRELTESRKKIDETTEELARATGTGPEDEAARWLKQARKNPLTPPVLLILEDMLGKVAGPDAVLNYRKANVSDGRLVLENVAVEGRMGLQGPLVIDQVILTTVAGDEGGEKAPLLSCRMTGLRAVSESGDNMQVSDLHFQALDWQDKPRLIRFRDGLLAGFRADQGQGSEGEGPGEKEAGFLELESIHVTDFELKNLASLKVGRAGFQGFAFRDRDTITKLRDLWFENLDFRDIHRLWASRSGRMGLKDLSVEEDGRRVIGLASLESDDSFEDHFAYSRIQATDFNIEAARLTGAVRNELLKLGYDRIKINQFSLNNELDRETDEYLLNELLVDADEAGRIEIGGKLSGVRLDPEGMAASLFGLLESARLVRLKLSYYDRSLLGRILRSQAESNGLSEGQFRELVLLSLKGATNSFRSESLDQLVAQLVKFIENPGELHVGIAPENPVPIGQVGDLSSSDPDRALELLKISAEAK